MKKYFLSLVAIAAAMLFATSCQESLVEPQLAGPTTFSVQLPDAMGTKAEIGSANTVNQLFVSVYAKDFVGDPLASAVVEKDQGDGTFTVSFNLIQDQTYDLIFWAQTTNAYVDKLQSEDATYDLRTIKIEDRFYSNENGAAFYACQTVTIDGKSKDVTLRRPFAQLNIGTTVESLKTDADSDIILEGANIEVRNVASSFNTVTGFGEGTATIYGETDLFVKVAGEDIQVNNNQKYAELEVGGKSYVYVTMDYLPIISSKEVPKDLVEIKLLIDTDQPTAIEHTFSSVPVQRNYRTNIVGNLISSTTEFNVVVDEEWAGGYDVENGNVSTEVNVDSAEELLDAFENEEVDEIVLNDNIDLNDLFNLTKAAESTEDPTLTIGAGRTLTIDLNGKTLSATSSQTGKNYNMFDVRGTFTVKNGIMEYEHKGENMGWGASTNLFNVTAGGVLNLEGVTAKNLGGSDMGFVVHLNNWGEVTLNAENCTLESNYVPVRVFNSGPNMNNVTIKNSTLKGVSTSFWVHNYTKDDFGTQEKADSQKELLNLNIYNQGNTFIPDPDEKGLRYGFTNSIRTDAYGIYKVVSEDGTEVTLSSVIKDGLVRRGVAGTEENTTIKKVVVEEGVATLYDRTFRRFYALETVELPNTLTTIGAAGSGVFQSCTNLKNIVIPESVTVLGKGTFQECASLESINIPSGVTRIEADCLRATGLVSVEFHAGVTYFGAQAFRDCKQLTEVIINAPEFTMEGNTFGIMAAPFTPMTIYVANSEMKAYVESKLTNHEKTYITVVAPNIVSNTSDLQEALSKGQFVALANDLTITPEEALTAPYGNKAALSQNGGVFDGNGKNISYTGNGDNYVLMTNGGTIKNLDIDRGFRGIVLMYPNQDVYVDNVKIGVDDEVCYTINTAEGDGEHNLYVSNSVLYGWCSIGTAVKSVNFTNCTFGQGTYYTNVMGRLVKPYVDAVFEGCNFCSKCYIDLSAFVGTKVTLKNCTVNGVKITAENWTRLVAPEDTCAEGQISVELKNGTFLTAENVADYIIFQ